jgi:TIR domain-containing protein
MAGEIFLNYRREDSGQAAGRIFDQLKVVFGPDRIFMDIDTVPPAVDFTSHILNSLTYCRLMVVIIGKEWLSARGKSLVWRKRRIDAANDWVRREIEIAIVNKIPLLPVLIDGAECPRPVLCRDRFPHFQTGMPSLSGMRISAVTLKS